MAAPCCSQQRRSCWVTVTGIGPEGFPVGAFAVSCGKCCSGGGEQLSEGSAGLLGELRLAGAGLAEVPHAAADVPPLIVMDVAVAVGEARQELAVSSC